jgi:hypothetical protein
MPAGDKYRLYLHDADTFHTLFALDTDSCVARGVRQAKCDEIARWLQSVALAFLDGHVRRNVIARKWLQTDNIGVASQGIAEWSHK